MMVRPLYHMKLHSTAEQVLKHKVKDLHRKISFQQDFTVMCKGGR